MTMYIIPKIVKSKIGIYQEMLKNSLVIHSCNPKLIKAYS